MTEDELGLVVTLVVSVICAVLVGRGWAKVFKRPSLGLVMGAVMFLFGILSSAALGVIHPHF